jgi:dUTP pyrophosphatase
MRLSVDIKLEDNLLFPVRAHQFDAGLDLKSTVNTMIAPNECKMVDTGIAVKIPPGYVGLVFARSSMGKVRVTLGNSVGVIDESYRGNIKVLIHNHGAAYYEIKKYDRIAQLVIMPIALPQLLVYEGTDDGWNDTARGEGGFGSSGKQ